MFHLSRIGALENKVKELEKKQSRLLEHIASAEEQNWKQWELIAKLWDLASNPHGK